MLKLRIKRETHSSLLHAFPSFPKRTCTLAFQRKWHAESEYNQAEKTHQASFYQKKMLSNISWQDGCQGVFSNNYRFVCFLFQKLLGNHWEVKCVFPFIKWGKEPTGIIKICEYLHYTDIGYQDSIYTQKHGFLSQI